MIADRNFPANPDPASPELLLVEMRIIWRFWLEQRRKEIVAILAEVDAELETLTHEIEGTRPPRLDRLPVPPSIHALFQKAGEQKEGR